MSQGRYGPFSGGVETEKSIIVFVPGEIQTMNSLDTLNNVLSVSEKNVDSQPVIMYSAGVLVGDSIFCAPKVVSFIGVLHLLQVPWVVLPWNDDAVANWGNDGSEKYSAAVRVDNAVYFVPYSANNVGVLDVSNAQPQFAKLTLDGQLQGPQKFSDGVHVNGRIWCHFHPVTYAFWIYAALKPSKTLHWFLKTCPCLKQNGVAVYLRTMARFILRHIP